jgi:hypothetical protein
MSERFRPPAVPDAARVHHDRFRALYGDIAESRRAILGAEEEEDWVVRCVDSIDAFLEHFADRVAFEEWIEERERHRDEVIQLLRSERERIQREGLSYLDIEQMRYVLPSPKERNDRENGDAY